MSIIVRVFGQRLLYEHAGAVYLVRGPYMSMIVRVFGQMLLRKHDSASIWSEALI